MEETILSVSLGPAAYFSFAREYTEYDTEQRNADSLQETGIAK